MHLDYIAAKAGTCPICGMRLVPNCRETVARRRPAGTRATEQCDRASRQTFGAGFCSSTGRDFSGWGNRMSRFLIYRRTTLLRSSGRDPLPRDPASACPENENSAIPPPRRRTYGRNRQKQKEAVRGLRTRNGQERLPTASPPATAGLHGLVEEFIKFGPKMAVNENHRQEKNCTVLG